MRRRSAAAFLLPVALALVAVGAAYRATTAWLQLGSPVDVSGDAEMSATEAQPPIGQVALSLPPIEEFQVVVERPLFSPDRRPPQPAPPEPESAAEVEAPAAEAIAPPEPPPPPPISFTLVGIVMFGDQRVALLQPLDGGKAVQLREGEEFAGWTAALIDRERAVFRNAYSEEELRLDFRAPLPAGMLPAQTVIPQSGSTESQ